MSQVMWGLYICGRCDIGLCGSELVFIPGSVGVESSWVGVEFTLKVVRLEDGIFPTTTILLILFEFFLINRFIFSLMVIFF